MSKRKIVIEPDPILRKKSSLIENVDDQVRRLMDDMLLTMYEAPGIGLAAIQIGILKRLAKLILWGFVLVFGGGSVIMGFNDESNRITLLSIGLGIFIAGFNDIYAKLRNN